MPGSDLMVHGFTTLAHQSPVMFMVFATAISAYLLVARRISRVKDPHEKDPHEKQKLNILITADPGPDPDDAKVIAMAGVQHAAGEVNVVGIVTNGGHQPIERAKLTVAILRAVGASNIPVAYGALGRAENPSPHVFACNGYDDVDQECLFQSKAMIMRILHQAAPQSLTVQIQSAGTDIANIIEYAPDLFKAKVSKVSIMGGLEKKMDEATGEERWVGDAAQNNVFDPSAMEVVYQFCLKHRIVLHVVGRNAVPSIPMTVAQDYAGTGVGVLDYLAMMQESGLVSLWKNVRKTGTQRTLPARCDAAWYWTTFCGVKPAEYQALQGAATMEDIRPHLRGTIKPYDVVAYLTCLPHANQIFDFGASEVEVNGQKHYFFLTPEQMPHADDVIQQLTDTYDRILVRAGVAQRKHFSSQVEPGCAPTASQVV